jgi:phospholipid/cholesterol/gamma-HCH transport system substrate-binding protein
METEGRYTLVGMLVLVVVAVLAAALVWLAGAADRIAYQTYTLYFQKQSLDGLAVGSAVKMRGIKVGIVGSYRFVRGGDEAVSVTARIDEGVPVYTGAVAYIKRNLVTGIAAVEIDNGPSANPLLVQAPQGERYPVIAEGSSDIDRVATAVSRLSVNGAQVLEKMNALLSEDNQRAIGRTLANLDELSSHLADNRQSLDALVQGMRDAADEFRFAGASISQAATRAEGSIAGVGDQASAVLREAIVAMEKLQRDAALIAARVQQFTDTGALEMTNVSRDVRSSADALTTAGQRLSEPRAILFGPSRRQLGPGEKLP